ncbi:transposase [Streptomyces sp. NPDC059278]|uniref:transposase n=1 Tax=Streptomyces sp. NPDC059278 TaxID=3346801 RepID=UPI0036B03CA8
MTEKRRKDDAAFCEGAVRIALETGKASAEVSRDLGVRQGTLQTWVHRAKTRAAEEAAGGLNESECEEQCCQLVVWVGVLRRAGGIRVVGPPSVRRSPGWCR